MNRLQTDKKEFTPDEVLAAIRKVVFGSVLVKVHQGRILGYEVTEKKQV